jgi:hypothetical protein
MALVTFVEPASEPVQLADMKSYLRLASGFTDDDPYISGLIMGARRWAEVYCRRRFLYQTVRLELDFFPGYISAGVAGGASHYAAAFASGANLVLAGLRYAIQLPFPPVYRLAAFTYTDQNGNATPLVSGTDYVADFDSSPARLMPPFGKFWPIAQVIGNAVKIDFVAGYGGNIAVSTTATSVNLGGYKFAAEDEGSPITIPGAGAAGAPLAGVIATVDSSGNGALSVAAATTVSGAPAYLGKPVPALIPAALMLLVSDWYEKRLPGDVSSVPRGVRELLGPYRDLRF